MTLLFNMGLPMIVPAMVFMIIGLIPIILIEAIYLSKRLTIAFKPTIGSVIIANVVLTIVGIPATWLILFIVQLITGGTSSYGVNGFLGKLLSVTLQAPWLLPFGENEAWIFYVAALFLLIPFFFSTWLVEYVVMRDKLAIEVVNIENADLDLKVAEKLVFKGTRNANLLTYGCLAFLLSAGLITAVIG
ncbi:MAG: hypothetical protein AB7Q37_05180 [Pyrinomonadaceae bacterium]